MLFKRLFIHECILLCVGCWCVTDVDRRITEGVNSQCEKRLKIFCLGWGDIWPKSNVILHLFLVSCEKGTTISFLFPSCIQILTLTLAWWLELPPWTPWCRASVWCLHQCPRTCQLWRRSSTARAAPSFPPTPVSHTVIEESRLNSWHFSLLRERELGLVFLPFTAFSSSSEHTKPAATGQALCNN